MFGMGKKKRIQRKHNHTRHIAKHGLTEKQAILMREQCRRALEASELRQEKLEQRLNRLMAQPAMTEADRRKRGDRYMAVRTAMKQEYTRRNDILRKMEKYGL